MGIWGVKTYSMEGLKETEREESRGMLSFTKAEIKAAAERAAIRDIRVSDI